MPCGPPYGGHITHDHEAPSLLRFGALALSLPLLVAGSAFGASSARQAANVCPNGKPYKPDPGFVPQACNQIYRGTTNKHGTVQLKVVYNPDTDKQIVSKFALTAKARCSDGKTRKMLQGFRDQIRHEGEIANGRFEMTREQSSTSAVAVTVKGTVSRRRASGTASWTLSFQPFKGIENGVPQYGDTITCRSGRHRWSARLVPSR